MAVSPYVKPEPLNEWSLHMESYGRGNWWFNQAQGTDAIVPNGARVYLQNERDLIAQGLVSAIHKMENKLCSPIMPTYVSETLTVDQVDCLLQNQYLTLKYGNVIAFGTRATTELEADASITYSRVNLPNNDDTATITITDSDTDPDEIQVFIRVADGAPSAGHEKYRIYPLNVVRTNSTTITITGDRALFVSPDVWNFQYQNPSYEDRNFADMNGTADFLTAVDVYRVYTDTTDAVVVKGSPASLSSATSATVTASPRLVDAKYGTFQARFSNLSTSGYIDSVEVNYLAGFALINQRIDHRLAIPTIRLANTYFPEQIAPIYDVTFGRYANDRVTAQDIQPMLINNPFGVKNGQLFAWSQAQALTLGNRIGVG